MKSTYKAVEVSAPGTLRVAKRSVPEPGVGQVRIRVEACEICHTNAATVTVGDDTRKMDRGVPTTRFSHVLSIARATVIGSGVHARPKLFLAFLVPFRNQSVLSGLAREQFPCRFRLLEDSRTAGCTRG